MSERPIYDCHVNIWNDEHLVNIKSVDNTRIRPGEVEQKADADTLYAAMAGVEKAIVFNLRYGDSTGEESTDETAAACVAKYPGKFVGFGYVDPRRSDYMDLLHHAVEDLGLKGMKFGPIYNGVAMDDPRLDPVYEYLQRKNLPLTLHMGTTYVRNAPIDFGRPLHVEPVAMRYPELTMIMAHMGHPWHEDCIAVSRKQPNVFCEVSALYYRPWQYYNTLICAQEYLMTDKIFFGTDFPYTTVQETIDGLRNINDQLEGTKLPRVTQETMDRIIYSNPFEHWWKGDNPLK